MSAAANIVAFDGAATPTSHTFLPIGNDRSELGEIIAKWRETLATMPEYASARIRTSLRFIKKTSTWRAALIVEVPVMESVGAQNAAGYTAAPAVAYVNAFHLIAYTHQRATPAERKLLRQLSLNVGSGTTTAVTPSTTGPAAELFDQLISAQ